jgi:hypothetical protein
MKSQIKWLIPKYYKDLPTFNSNIFDLKKYIEKVYYYKEGECGMAPCYLEDKHIFDEHYPEIRITKEDAELLLFDSEKEAIEKLKIMLKELIPEYGRRINNIKCI